jgi:glycosyltransferase involved in cell wall biosynthesis
MVKYSHICIVTSSNISEDGIGGEGKYSVMLYNWLKTKNINCTLFSSFSIGIKTFKPNYEIKSSSEGKRLTKRALSVPYPLFMMKRLIISVILSLKMFQLHYNSPISLIHAQDTGYTGLAALMVGKVLKVPVIVSSHGIRHKTIHHGIKSKMKGIILRIERNLDKFTLKNADEVFVDNEIIKTYFEKMVKRSINIIPIPIQLDKFRYSLDNRNTIRNELRCNECKLLGFVGRFAPEKNLFTLIRAFSNVLDNAHHAKLVLVGTGPLESEIKDHVRKMNIAENVIFLGARHDVSKILSGLDVFILPSYTEGMSVALLEAMATGRAIIGSKISTISEIVTDSKEGILVDPYDPTEIQKAIIELFENDSLSKELGSNANEKALQFDINTIFPKLIYHYEKLMETYNLK